MNLGMRASDVAEVTWYGILAPLVTAPVQVSVQALRVRSMCPEKQLFYTERAYRLTRQALWVPLISLPLMWVHLRPLPEPSPRSWLPGQRPLIRRAMSLAGSFGLKFKTVGVTDLLKTPVNLHQRRRRCWGRG
jgi:hypothetical protein